MKLISIFLFVLITYCAVGQNRDKIAPLIPIKTTDVEIQSTELSISLTLMTVTKAEPITTNIVYYGCCCIVRGRVGVSSKKNEEPDMVLVDKNYVESSKNGFEAYGTSGITYYYYKGDPSFNPNRFTSPSK